MGDAAVSARRVAGMVAELAGTTAALPGVRHAAGCCRGTLERLAADIS